MKTKWLAFAALFILMLVSLPSVVLFPQWGDTTLERLSVSFNIAATVAGIGGLFGLLYQFERERDLNEAQFIVQLNKDFIENQDISRIYQLLEESKAEKQKQNPFSDSDIIKMANYLSFFEPFWGLTERGVVQLKTLDPVLAYRFFLATNNRFMQSMLLCKSGKRVAWRDVYRLHNAWRTYRIDKRLPIWQPKYDLARRDAYGDIVSGVFEPLNTP